MLGLSCGARDLHCSMQDLFFFFFSCGMCTSQLWHADFLVAACELLVAACIWDLVPQPGVEPGPPALGVQSLTHWITREVPVVFYI